MEVHPAQTFSSFVQHQLSQVTNFWRQGRSAVFHLKSLNNGQAELSLTFQLPHPSEIIPPPLSTSTATSYHPASTPLPRRPIVPLFPAGNGPHSQPKRLSPGLSSRQQKSHQRAVLHRASQKAAQLPRKRFRSSSPVSLPQQLRQDFSLHEVEESPGSSPLHENLREAYSPSSPPPSSLNLASPIRRDAMPCSPIPTPTPESPKRESPPES